MNMKKKDPESTEMTFFEHIDALRPHLVRGVMAIGVIGLVAFFCKSFIIDTVLFGPQSPDFPTNRMLTWVGAQWAHMAEWLNSVLGTSFDTDPETFRIANDRFSIINTSLSGQFNLHMKISLLTGLAMAMPYTLWEFWRFVRPALTPKEIQGTHLFVFWVSLCFFGGLLFGYFVMAPLSINFFAITLKTRRARRCVPPKPGVMPRPVSGWPKTAVSEQMRKSQLIASSQPPPRA